MYEMFLPGELEAHYQERLREAENERMVLRMRAATPKKASQLRVWIGDLLIACGEWLKASTPRVTRQA